MSLEDSSSSSPSSATTVDLTYRRLITRRRRRRHCHNGPQPALLDWPSSSLSLAPVIARSSSSASPVVEDLTWMDSDEDDDDDKKERPVSVKKKSRKQLYHSSAVSCNKSSGLQSVAPSSPPSLLWSDKYTPKRSPDLAVAPKKVKQIRQWLQRQQQQQSSSLFCKFLILAGSPGIGKSTMVRILAKELQMEVHEWTEPFFSKNNHSFQTNEDHGSSSLPPLQSFQQFLESVGAGFPTLDLVDPAMRTTATTKHPSASSLILIDEIPNLHDENAEIQFREILKRHIHRTLIGGDGSIPPTIWIYSDTVEGKVDHRRLGRILDLSNTTANNNNYYQIWQIAPPTKVQFRKVLKAIASQEGVLYKHINDDDFDKLHAQCGGDLRFAISQYQFRWATATKKQTTRRKQQHSTDISLPDSNQVHTRDQRLSSFHALGKLLYAKRYHPSLSGKISSIQQRKHPDDERPSLAFDPETVMEQSEMEVHGILHFLEHHCVDFFTDIFELADSLSYFSDAAVLYDYDSRGGGKNPSAAAAPNQDHAASLACRSVACCNQHAAASRFRQLSAPKIFEVMHKRHENQSRIESMSSVRFFGTTCLRESAVVFATEVLPWSRKIVPSNHPFGCTSFLVSHFDPGVSSALSSCSFSSRQQSSTHHAIEQPAEMIWREQQEILRMDDIVEDGDEDW